MRAPAFNHKNVIMESVESSTINKIGYDEENQVLKVLFNNGGVYLYSNVEPYHYKNMLTNVKSVGRYFNDSIKNYAEKYPCFKVEADETNSEE